MCLVSIDLCGFAFVSARVHSILDHFLFSELSALSRQLQVRLTSLPLTGGLIHLIAVTRTFFLAIHLLFECPSLLWSQH